VLTYLLALVVGLGSFGLYLAAFWFPFTYRKYDLIWSGVGLFYALVLWVCAGRITGGVLVGQLASVALLGWFVWQTLDLRWRQLPIANRPLTLATANSFSEVSQIQLKQAQASFKDGSWKLAFYDWLDRSPAQVKVVFKTVQSWIEALLSTTLQPQPLESDRIVFEADRIASRDSVPPEDMPLEDMPLEDTAAADFAAAWDDLRLDDLPEIDAPNPQPVSKSETPPPDDL
jgi:Ycf66 protein N-terminus